MKRFKLRDIENRSSKYSVGPKKKHIGIHLLVQQGWSGPKPHNQPQHPEQVNKLLHTTDISKQPPVRQSLF